VRDKKMTSTLKWADMDLVRELGQGQAGSVWLATLKRPFRCLNEGDHVAVKIFRRWVFEQPGQYDRIMREIQTGSSIEHPNLVRTFSLIAGPEDLPVLVMRYYAGQTLEDYLKTHRAVGTLPVLDDAFQIIGGLASALAALHDRDVVHRDVKPSNVILSNGIAVLMDLGVVAVESMAEATTTTEFLGTIRYAAPEYLFGTSFDKALDIYSLGTIAYELFSGRQFFGKENHWARLITARSTQRVDWKTEDSLRLIRNGGTSYAGAALYIMQKALAPLASRKLDLRNLADAILTTFWKQPYGISREGITVGEPMMDAPWGWDSSGIKMSVSQVAIDVKARLSPVALGELVKQLNEELLEPGVFVMDGGLYDEMVTAGIIRCFEVDGEPTIFFHPSVKAAWRCGYLE
jgi:serine/threonine protein kinase